MPFPASKMAYNAFWDARTMFLSSLDFALVIEASRGLRRAT
jgi:hypothetical protein